VKYFWFSNVQGSSMTNSLLRTTFPLIGALALTTAVAAAAGPKTPLGAWMKPNMGAPLAGQDFATLQKSFEFVAGKPPPSGDYPQWATFAKAGAAAAAKPDAAAVKAACKQCHDAYQEKYRKEFPTRPFP
jgi:cytochrome c553